MGLLAVFEDLFSLLTLEQHCGLSSEEFITVLKLHQQSHFDHGYVIDVVIEVAKCIKNSKIEGGLNS